MKRPALLAKRCSHSSRRIPCGNDESAGKNHERRGAGEGRDSILSLRRAALVSLVHAVIPKRSEESAGYTRI